jgi:hypothetical protein
VDASGRYALQPRAGAWRQAIPPLEGQSAVLPVGRL